MMPHNASYCLWWNRIVIIVSLLFQCYREVDSFASRGLAFFNRSPWHHHRLLMLASPFLVEQYDDFLIRDCRYSDLQIVSEIMVKSFYSNNTLSSPWKHMYRLSELNRIQQNFPYGDDRHRMLVAVAIGDAAAVGKMTNLGMATTTRTAMQQEQIVAFCDIDSRPTTRWQDPPRPYLSDLAVDPEFRRRGIARALVTLCEGIVVNEMKQSSLYIRVERDNVHAMQMYQKLLYQPQSHETYGVKDKAVLLHKLLVPSPTTTCSLLVE